MGYFRYGELPLVLLVLMAREPLNGYELMSELQRLFGPAYQPSPGSVYPALAALEREKLIEHVGEDVPRRYQPTERGVASSEARSERLAEVELRTGTHLRSDGSVEDELSRLNRLVHAAHVMVEPIVLRKVLERASAKVKALMDDEGGRL